MLRIYSGVPGSGKTYKMVEDLEKFLDENPGVVLLTNVRDLKLMHVDFEDFVNECFPDLPGKVADKMESFFDLPYQQVIHERLGGMPLYALDECHRYFHRRFKIPLVEGYFAEHRHIGHSLFLTTQVPDKQLNGAIIGMAEDEIHAVRRTLSMFGEFRYRLKSPQTGDVIDTFTVRPKKRVFDLYKSFLSAEVSKPKKQLYKKCWPLLIIIIGGIFFYRQFLDTDAKVRRLAGASAKVDLSTPVSGQSVRLGSDQETTQQLEALNQEVTKLREQINETERVFLPVIAHGDRKTTIDPDTQAVVDLGKIKHRVICVNGGLTCYFDRPVNSGVKVAATESSTPYPGQAASYSPYQSMPYQDAISRPQTGTGFSSPFPVDLIPEPEKIKSGPITIGRQPE